MVEIEGCVFASFKEVLPFLLDAASAAGYFASNW
jgi:hypothetical protein